VNNDFNLITKNELKYCSIEHYESIYKTCRRRLFNNDCLTTVRASQERKNRMGCEYQFMHLSDSSNRSLIITNRTSLQEKHVFLYDLIDNYAEFYVNDSGIPMSFRNNILKTFYVCILIFLLSR
jgi:hypothetical protein